MGKFIDLSGKRFGHWTVIERDDSANKKNIYWKCVCDCGTIRSVSGTSLRSGLSISCGCDKDKKSSIRAKEKVKDLTGQRFGKWTVIERDWSESTSSKRGARWICRCDCGTVKSVLGYSLKSGRTMSCGCKNGESQIIDLTGNRYGKLVVIGRDEQEYDDHKGARWICQCDCGRTVSVLSGRLRKGYTKSCGCSRHESKKRKNEDLTGKKIGKWTVLGVDNSQKGKGLHYYCECECGTIRSVSKSSLVNGFSKSCGCGKSTAKYNLTGKKFGKLTVIGVDEEKDGKGVKWICQCDCGTIKSYRTNQLVGGNVISCGCESRIKASERNFKDISNERFGRLVAICIDHKEIDNSGNSKYYWKCKCDCGNEIVVQGDVLRRGDTKSCGCLQAEESANRAKERTEDLIGKRFGLLTVVERVSVPGNDSFSTWKCICDCGNEKLADGYYLKKGMISSCGCLKQSKFELFVLQYFDEIGYENSIDYEMQKRFDDLRGYSDGMLSYDFSVIKNNKIFALIECQGQQHYKPVKLFGGTEQFAKQQIHDEIKREYANKMGVPLIEIPYTVVNYEDVKEILKKAGI